MYGAFVRDNLSLRPSEYWARQCYLGASFMSRVDREAVPRTGVDRVMWGADYPHTEGTHPHTAEALRYVFAGVPHDEVALLLGGNAAKVYGFDWPSLRSVADDIGPRVGDVDTPIAMDEIPDAALSMALREGAPA
jgi:hypothetical protein